MTDKNDGPNKGQDPSGTKRPFATIDLKATEIKAATASSSSQTAAAEKVVAAAQSSKTAAANAAAAMAAAANPAGTGSAATAGSTRSSATSVPETKTSSSASADDRFAAGTASAGKSATAGTASAAAREGGSGFGRFLSHVAAGIAGGVLALLGLQHLAPSLGIDAGRPQATTVSGIAPDHAARLNVLEKQVRERLSAPAAPTDGARSPAMEASLGRLDEVAKQLAIVSEMQTKLATDQALMRDELGKRALGGAVGSDAADRLAKLEEQIATMAKAATADPQNAGRLPQLAQITGQIADLRSALDTRLAAQRKDFVQEIETRTTAINEAAEAAKAGAKRVDGEVAQMKTETARMSERLDQLKSGSDKFEQALKSLQAEAQGLKPALESVKTNVAEQFKAAAKPTDIALAVTPLSTKVTALESSVQSVLKAEEDRKSNAERIVLSLELSNLKRAMDRGQKYTAELAEVKKVAGSRVDLTALEKFQNEGVPAISELQRTFRTVANTVIDADAQQGESSIVDRLWSGAKSVVRVRKTSHNPNDNSAEAIVGRVETALKEQRLADVMTEAQKLAPKAAVPAQDWLKKVDARRTVEVALATIDQALKSSLGAGPAGQKGTKQ